MCPDGLFTVLGSCWMLSAGAFDLPLPALPKEPVMVIEAPAASRASVRKDFLAVHAYDAAAGLRFAIHSSAPSPSLQPAGMRRWRATQVGASPPRSGFPSGGAPRSLPRPASS